MTNTMYEITDRDDSGEFYGERAPQAPCEGDGGCLETGDRCIDPYDSDINNTRVWTYLCAYHHERRSDDI